METLASKGQASWIDIGVQLPHPKHFVGGGCYILTDISQKPNETK